MAVPERIRLVTYGLYYLDYLKSNAFALQAAKSDTAYTFMQTNAKKNSKTLISYLFKSICSREVIFVVG